MGIHKKTQGFTIVELVVVITVIGILSAIVVISYNTWQQKIESSKVSSDLSGAYSAMENVRNFSSGYPASIPTTFTGSSGVQLSYIYGDNSSFCIQGTSVKYSSIKYYLNTREGKTPIQGTCPVQSVAPPVPVLSQVVVDGSGAQVTWSAASGATGYDLQYRTGAGAWTAQNSAVSPVAVSGLVPSSTYEFQVRSKNASLQSAWSASTSRVVVPKPTIISVTSVDCGNGGGLDAWVDGNVTWTATAKSITATYFFENIPGQVYGQVPKTVANPTGSGSLSSWSSSTKWNPSGSGSGTMYLYGIGPNGEKSLPAIWGSPVYPAYYC